jgi:hypothetical protein
MERKPIDATGCMILLFVLVGSLGGFLYLVQRIVDLLQG